MPSVSTCDLLTVSDVIVWPSGAIPATGHYCFVALIGDAHDPAPAPAEFLSWDNFRQFIRANNSGDVAEFQRRQQHISGFERATKLCAVAISGGRRARQSAADAA